MTQFIEHISARGLHGHFNLELSFKDGVNILYGRNGSGKTTLLHIVANAINLDLPRFSNLTFQDITLTLSDSCEFVIEKEPDSNTVRLRHENTVVHEFNELEFPSDPRGRQLHLDEYFDTVGLRNTLNLTAVPTYFPAFRTMIEAWSFPADDGPPRRPHRSIEAGPQELRQRRRRRNDPTDLARRLFGPFVPSLSYPSPNDIEDQVNRSIQFAIFRIARTDQSLQSSAFIEAFAAISGSDADSPEPRDADSILKEIETLSERLQEAPVRPDDDQSARVYEQLREQIPSFRIQSGVDSTTRKVLSVYETALRRRLNVQTGAFAEIYGYVAAVNKFLEGKELVIEPLTEYEGREHPALGVRSSDGRTSRLITLSSGERQIVGLIYAASQIDDATVILIDEPELSLHIDWQRKLIGEMVEQLPSKQLIICTHSPFIGAAFASRMIELEPSAADRRDVVATTFDEDVDPYDNLDLDTLEEIL